MITKIFNKVAVKVIYFTFLLLTPLLLTSCSDDDASSGIPEITSVCLCPPEKADSTFTKTWPGTQIAIMGRNMSNILKVYINDQEVYFNPMMNTDHSVIVTIPTEADGFKLTAFNNDLKDEIRIETSHGTATYAFKVLNPAPALQRIAGIYPRAAGNNLQLFGLNILDVERVYLTDVVPEEIDSLRRLSEKEGKSFTIPGNKTDIAHFALQQNHYLNPRTKNYETSSVMDFTMPAVSYQSGSMVVECAAGIAYVEFAALPPKPVIQGLSSDMPMPGERVVISGRNFIQVEAIRYGDVTIPASQLYASESEDSIIFTMGEVPTENRSRLTVVTPGGEGSVDFFERERILVDFDGRGVDNGWGPNCLFGTADAAKPPYSSMGQFANINVQDYGSNWWGQMIYFRADNNGGTFLLPGYDLIPADTSTDEVWLAVECFNDGTCFDNSAHIHYFIQTANSGDGEFVNWSWDTNGYLEPVLASADDETPLGQWYRAAIPMSHVNIFKGKTYQDIVDAGITNIRMMEVNYTNTPLKLNLYFDNIRLVTISPKSF